MTRYIPNSNCYDGMNLSKDKVKECDLLVSSYVAGLDAEQKLQLRSSTSNNERTQEGRAIDFLGLYGDALWGQGNKNDFMIHTTAFTQLLRNKAMSIHANTTTAGPANSKDDISGQKIIVDALTIKSEEDSFYDDGSDGPSASNRSEGYTNITSKNGAEGDDQSIDGEVVIRSRLEATAETQVSSTIWKHSLSPNILYHATIIMKTSQSSYSKSVHLQDCLTLPDFIQSIHRLWNLSDGAGDIKGLTYDMQIGKINMRVSEDIELGHKVMMNMIGEWWAERVNGFAYHCFAYVTIMVKEGFDVGVWWQMRNEVIHHNQSNDEHSLVLRIP